MIAISTRCSICRFATAAGKPLNIASLTIEQVRKRPIIIGDHCYACTAGAGSSCGGALV